MQMCHCREAKDRKYHKPNKEQTASSNSRAFSFYKPDHRFCWCVRYEFSPNYQVNPQIDIGGYSRQVSLQRSLGNKYMLHVQYSVRRAAAEVLFFLLSFGFDLFGAHKRPSSCRPEPQEHDSTASTSAELLVASTLKMACVWGFLLGRTCNLGSTRLFLQNSSLKSFVRC